jgi:hypothetical protein
MASTLATRFGANRVQFRSPDNSPLTHDTMRRYAPSIFAEAAHASRSERYGYIPTISVVEALEQEGFSPFMVGQCRTRDEGQREYTKHMIRFRHANEIARADQNEAEEIILINSHNGTSSYQMLCGTFRFVCMNGMVCGDVIEDVRIPHKGDVIGAVKEGASMVLDGTDLVREVRQDMKGIGLNRDEQQIFAESALALRYPEADTTKPAPITAEQILRPRRMADTRDDLWSTFNVIQENAIKGGLHGRNASNRRTTTRAVTGIEQDRKLNQQLWILAERMRALKNGTAA